MYVKYQSRKCENVHSLGDLCQEIWISTKRWLICESQIKLTEDIFYVRHSKNKFNHNEEDAPKKYFIYFTISKLKIVAKMELMKWNNLTLEGIGGKLYECVHK